MNIEEYFQEYTQNLHTEAGVGSNYLRSTFVANMCSLIEEEGTIPDFTQTDYKLTAKGLAVDAWSYDTAFSKLTLFVADFRDENELETLTQTDITDGFKRLNRLVEACLNRDFVTSLDESMPVTGLAWQILERHAEIMQVALVILSNARLSSRTIKLPNDFINGVKASYEIWDFERIYRIETSGRQREDIEIDFRQFEKNGIPCLPAHMGDSAMKSYLIVMPAGIVARLYEQYGERLLEQNVRTFLQFRGNINKGMRNTLVNEPHMFFSYNNGLSATAEDVQTNVDDTCIFSIRNLQIVNGGQTTASIFNAGTKGGGAADLAKVFVQVKLSIVAPDKVDEIVPRISEYSNTQNKVSAADFFSNHPFHRKIEEFSRRLWAPSPSGQVQQTHWFYERARGQYVNKQANLTNAERKKFLVQNPKKQMFSKTDLAKFVRLFEGLPHEVSKGAQKNFSSFAGALGNQWNKNDGRDFTELWFKQLIGKAILFRHLDAQVMRADWYTGYKANIVAYALAKFAEMVKDRGVRIDFLKIWTAQVVPIFLDAQLMEIAKNVNARLLSPPAGATSNVSEWAKNEACWNAVRVDKLLLHESIAECLMDHEQSKELEKDAGRDDVIHKGIKTQTYVIEKGPEHWDKLRDWNNSTNKLTPKELSILEIARNIPRKIPTEAQCNVLVAAEKRATEEGFFSR